jgi:hypothetical protein
MNSQTMLKLFGALLVLLPALPFLLADVPVSARPPFDATPVSSEFKNAKTLKDPCASDSRNLIRNGSMAPSHDTQYGSLADQWEPFIFDGSAPTFRWVGNEQIDPHGSQQIFSGGTFDAGIYQTVGNLQPGIHYWFRVGYSLAAKSYSGPNVRVSSIGRKVGVDPFGGTDPKSANVIWNPDLFDGNAAVNVLEMIMLFPARSPNATIFIRAMARDGSGGENRVWLDAVCMEARTELPTAIPPPPTVTPPPSATATRPPATRPPATRIAQAPTAANTPVPASPTIAKTPTPPSTATPVASPRYARPDATPAPSLPIDPGTGVATGLGLVSIFTGFVSSGIGILLLIRQSQPVRSFRAEREPPAMWQ